ncbi:ParA family protein [Variovorax paradoxus]|uniref:ParA family protein n=1 Tax=Variovorax paradoxus TaxID=34073 RepID=UPI001ABC2441
MKTLTVANQKGGVGKTTLTVHSGYAAAGANLRVLMVDFDPQASLSLGFNIVQPNPEYLTSADLFSHDPVTKKPQPYDGNIDIIPADERLFDLISASTDDAIRARTALRAIGKARKYDLCIIDTPPERNLLLVAALAIADFVVIPMTLGLYEQGGVERLIETIEGTRMALNPSLATLGIQLMKTNSKSAREREQVQAMRDQFPEYVLKQELTELASVRQAVNNRLPVWHNPRGSSHEKAAKEWRIATAHILNEVTR